jgi:hypothetical protein
MVLPAGVTNLPLGRMEIPFRLIVEYSLPAGTVRIFTDFSCGNDFLKMQVNKKYKNKAAKKSLMQLVVNQKVK